MGYGGFSPGPGSEDVRVLAFASRSRSSSGRLLGLRVALFGAGGILAVIGMGLRIRWLVNVAIGVLFVGFILRFVSSGDGPGAK